MKKTRPVVGRLCFNPGLLVILCSSFDIKHIDGKANVSDLLTKEMRDEGRYQQLSMACTSPLKVVDFLRERTTGRMEGGDSSTTPSVRKSQAGRLSWPSVHAPEARNTGTTRRCSSAVD